MVEPVFGGSKETWGGLLCRLKSLIRVSRDQSFSFWYREEDTLSNGNVSWKRKVQFRCSVMSNSLWPCGLQHTRLPCPSPTPRVYSNSCPFSQWYHSRILSSAVPFSSRLQSFPTSGFFQMSWFFGWSGQSIGVSSSASVLPINIQDWFPLGWTGWISLKFKGLSRIFSNTTVQKYQFFSTLLSL